MKIGIEQFYTTRDHWIDKMLLQPMRGPASEHVLEHPTPTKDISEPADALKPSRDDDQKIKNDD